MVIIENNSYLWFAYELEGVLTVTRSVLVEDHEIEHLLALAEGAELVEDVEEKSPLYLQGKKRTRVWQITDQYHSTTPTTSVLIGTN